MDEEVEQFYRERGFSRRVGGGDRPALLIVDLINAFTDDQYDLGSTLDGVVEKTAELLKRFRARDLPRYFTTIAYEESYGDAGVFIEKVPALRELRLGDEAIAVDPRLEPRGDERVLLKKYASAFFGTDLSTELVQSGVDTLLLTGCTTSGCIRASAVDGMQHGYRVLVPRDCVGDRAEPPHLANLFDIDAKYGDVLEWDETLEYLDRLPGDGTDPGTSPCEGEE